MKRAVFARHCNPWSAWTRWASAPLVLVPVWRRSWRDAALVGVWMAVNPMVFGKPAHERAWATRAVLGEEQWIQDRPMDAAMAVNVGASVAGLGAGSASIGGWRGLYGYAVRRSERALAKLLQQVNAQLQLGAAFKPPVPPG